MHIARQTGVSERAPHSPAALQRRRFLLEAYERHSGELRRYLRRGFGAGSPEPEDVVQTVFAKLAAFGAPEQIRNPRAFLYSAARNLVSDQLRRARTRAAFVAELADSARDNVYDLDPERVLESRERMALLAQALQQLSAVQRRVIVMNRFRGLSYAEIGAQLAMSPGAVRKHLERGLANCLRLLTAAGVSRKGAAREGDAPD